MVANTSAGHGQSVVKKDGVCLTVRSGCVIVEDRKVCYASPGADYTLTVPVPWWRAFVPKRFRRLTVP